MSGRPQRIQRQRTRGWRLPPAAVYVGRPTRWGNPFIIGSTVSVSGWDADHRRFDGVRLTMTPVMAAEAYRDLMAGRLTLGEDPDQEERAYVTGWHRGLTQLRGHDLACWCPLDRPCHADVLLALANR